MAEVNDGELRERLLQLGFSPGPVTDSTRKLYRKKLAQLEKERPAEPSRRQAATTTPPSTAPPATTVDLPTPPPPSYESVATNHAPLQPLQRPPPGAQVVVDQLCMTLNNPSHVASDTVLTFADGTVYVVCRAVIASQCSELIPFLYMTGENPYPVSIVSLTGQETQLSVYPSEIVADLKEKLAILQKVPVHQQRLVFKQSVLENPYRLGSSGVCSGSTVNLVLDTTANMAAASVKFTAPSISPALSISHFSIKLPLSQLCDRPLHPPSPHLSPITLPPSALHLLHIYDVPSDGFIMFLKYLYSRQLVLGSGSIATVIVCCVLAEYFNVPSLVQDALQCIGTMMSIDSAIKILQFAEQINSIHLKHTCTTFLAQHNISPAHNN